MNESIKLTEPKFGGNSMQKHLPIWELAAINNAKPKIVIFKVNGVVVKVLEKEA